MKKLVVFAVLLIVGGAVYLFKDVGHVPLFSASLERLAETETEAWCAGQAFWGSREPAAQKAAAAECRNRTDATPVDLQIVQETFCRSVVNAGYAQGKESCMNILVGSRLWPTYDGNITASWSRKFPYPGDALLQQRPDTNDSRTGDREGNFR